ncbi:winged helix-turn-helix domain-containing protein [Novosphingobium sp. 1949]|uniref:Winged helix-turn-helix domain-containing protein n=1 Tax=Novosphingobium organovorum TaxID=2930092 RepID=A0ABT0BA77_9SPHN|nr:winged helix-turn-helix domain-containing protein [Novosphingobium organovorum]MCJ2181977.1 winged helix-turn-helix domain-containing protein [Novosphingobium organovorum]
MSMTGSVLKIKLQIYSGEEIAMGPGKADLLDAIAEQGSISAAARTLEMSYRRAWLLVDAMNRCWKEPLVETAPGGSARGGARLTPYGRGILQLYRGLQEEAAVLRRSSAWDELSAALLAAPKAHQKA